MVAWKPEVKRGWVAYTQMGFGHVIYALFVPNHIGVVGLVWGWIEGTTFAVAGSYVEPEARRCGVRTRINEQILCSYERIRTGSGSKEGGLAFMLARGYKYHKASNTWYLTRAAAKIRTRLPKSLKTKGNKGHAKSKAK